MSELEDYCGLIDWNKLARFSNMSCGSWFVNLGFWPCLDSYSFLVLPTQSVLFASSLYSTVVYMMYKNKNSMAVMFLICNINLLESMVSMKQTKIQSDFLGSRYWPKHTKILVSKPNRQILSCFSQYLGTIKSDWIFVCFIETMASSQFFCI